MSEWCWRFGKIGWSKANSPELIFDMGGETWTLWMRMIGRLYRKVMTEPHNGEFWENKVLKEFRNQLSSES